MFTLSSSNEFFIYSEPSDMRKSFDSLSGLVLNKMKGNPRSGQVFIFINKPRNKIKLLHWETGGYVLYYKRLEKGTLEMPLFKDGSRQISWSELMMIVEGISLQKVEKRVRFSG
jgi:transposase